MKTESSNTMCFDRSKKSYSRILPAAIVVGCCMQLANAATTLAVTSAPVPNADDISQLAQGYAAGWSGINLAANNNPTGNTFTTGSSAGGYTFDSLSVNILSPQNAESGQTFRINLYTVDLDAGTATSVFAATATMNSVPVAGQYLTFVSNDGFVLNADTLYAFTVAGTSGSSIQWGYSNGDQYAGGAAFRVNSPTNLDFGEQSGTPGRGIDAGYDMTFNLGLTAVIPEPTALTLTALGGFFFLRRRR